MFTGISIRDTFQRRTAHFDVGAPGSSAETGIGVAGAVLRDRTRDLVRNNPHAAKAVAVLVNNIVGAGIMPGAASGDEALDRKVDGLCERWSAPATPTGSSISVGCRR